MSITSRKAIQFALDSSHQGQPIRHRCPTHIFLYFPTYSIATTKKKTRQRGKIYHLPSLHGDAVQCLTKRPGRDRHQPTSRVWAPAHIHIRESYAYPNITKLAFRRNTKPPVVQLGAFVLEHALPTGLGAMFLLAGSWVVRESRPGLHMVHMHVAAVGRWLYMCVYICNRLLFCFPTVCVDEAGRNTVEMCVPAGQVVTVLLAYVHVVVVEELASGKPQFCSFR